MEQKNSIKNNNQPPRCNTHQIHVGNVLIGGGAPIVVQSMLNLDLHNVKENIDQIERLKASGCEIIRIAVPNHGAIKDFKSIVKNSSLPVIADIHFDASLAIESIKAGASKIRINPGNIGGFEKLRSVLNVAKIYDVPIRIGVNAGSLEKQLVQQTDLSLAEKLSRSACSYVNFCRENGFNDLVVSAKAHDVKTTIETYRLLASSIPDVALHIGITEAGTLFQGLIKSSAGLGILLEEGIGDTLRISLTDDPIEEVRASWVLLSSLNLRKRYPELISCPTCGRCQVNLIKLAKAIELKLKNIQRPISVAVMGCVVNGPGEAADADIGVACGNKEGIIFSHGKILKKVNENNIVDALMNEIGKL